MIDETVRKLETKIQKADAVSAGRKRELLELLGTLKTEIAALSETHDEHARSIAGFVEVSAHEATRTAHDPELLQLSLQGLAKSVRGFESSHPRLVGVVDSLSHTLANLGI